MGWLWLALAAAAAHTRIAAASVRIRRGIVQWHRGHGSARCKRSRSSCCGCGVRAQRGRWREACGHGQKSARRGDRSPTKATAARRAGVWPRAINVTRARQHLMAALKVAAELWHVLCEPRRARERPLLRCGHGIGGSRSGGARLSCASMRGAMAAACSGIEDGRSLRAPHNAHRGRCGSLGAPTVGCRRSAAAAAARQARQRRH